MVGMGLWFMRRNRSSERYFKGGGKLPWFVVALSIYATMFSSITFLSVPAFVYGTDMRYFALTMSALLVAPIVVRWYLPYFRRLNLTSAYEYLEVRFNLACRLFASATFVVFMLARTAIVTYLPAVALSSVTGIDVNIAIVVTTAVTVLYCAIGGIEAVVWSDFVQALMLIGSAATILFVSIHGTDGGLSGFINMAAEGGKFRMFDLAFDWTKPVFWVVFLGGFVTNIASYTSDQSVVQRYMTTKDERGAGKSILANCLISFSVGGVFFVMGAAIWTFYRSHPASVPVVEKLDQILPAFVMQQLPPGVSGLVIAAVAAATMSTLSANLNSVASAITVDFYQRLFKGRHALLCGKISTIAIGVLGGALALVLANGNIYSAYAEFQRYLGVFAAGLGALFFMGVFLKRITGKAALAGLVVNYLVTLGLDVLPWSAKPHVLLYGFLGGVACVLTALAVSAVSRKI